MKLTLKMMIMALGTLLSWSTTAYAIQFQEGDVFAAVSNGQVQHYDSSGTLLETLDTTRGGYTTGMGFDSSGSLYVTNFSDASVSRFNNQGTLTDAQFVTTDYNSAVESIVFDASGNFYVGQADGTRDILKFDSSGTLLDRYDVATTARGSDWIDLAADQKTIYYTSENYEVLRYDTSTDTQLSNFATVTDRAAFALRILDDGGVLLSDSVNIKRLDSTGATIQTYDVASNNAFFSLNLDPDGTSFWAGDYVTGKLYKFDIASGALLQTIDTGVGSNKLYGVTVYGEITQGGGGGGTTVPEPPVVALLAVGLIGFGFSARRRNATKA